MTEKQLAAIAPLIKGKFVKIKCNGWKYWEVISAYVEEVTYRHIVTGTGERISITHIFKIEFDDK